jgi:methylmalonyl-CoA mutase N-terminal domain/subunit
LSPFPRFEQAAGKANLLPPILEAVKAYATLQEICDQMRAVFGEYKEKIVINTSRSIVFRHS